jgi:hypothetical protein
MQVHEDRLVSTHRSSVIGLDDLLNIRCLIAKKGVTPDWDKFALAFDGDPQLNVHQNRRTLPRAFFASQLQPAASHEDAWNAIHAPDFAPATTAVVEGVSDSILASTSNGQVTEIASAPNRLTVKVNANGPALLVSSQLWYPGGWQVTVDGRAQGSPLRTDYLFQGVALEAGSHTVELRFTSPQWRLGWVLAGMAGVFLVVSSLFVALRRR